ncbi:MAG: hypothetical protein EB141_17675 [Verrucomicrobia bacterium]|nr:hypothetical protein [Pseudomonadota bacterium]NDA68655.1 hypothetical protein [Verrucomicrobiota bacterium]NDB77442.1 hypothetical protein [Verrucomicrobiota bacterium]
MRQGVNVLTDAYGTSPTKRIRRTGAEMDSLLAAVTNIISAEEDAITIRHLFYRLVGERHIEKTEATYKSLCGHLSKWRRSGEVPWDSFADNTRWHIGHETFSGLDDALKNTVQCYRRDLWARQSAHVEIWGEKDAISSILSSEACDWGVKVFTCRGFASLSALYSAANTFKRAVQNGKKVFIYYFGDHDPSGLAIDRAAVDSFRDDFHVDVELTRAAVTPEQIQQHKLPTRPVKASDTRAGGWQGGCVEVDTMRPAVLREIVKDCITQHIDPVEWRQTQTIERAERETLKQFADSVRRAA